MPQSESTPITMWGLLERVVDLERRAGALYDRFADLFRDVPLAAVFWRDMASEERLHALIVAAAREVFPATAPAPSLPWDEKLSAIERLLSGAEANVCPDLPLEEAFAQAEVLETSELNAVTALIVQHAGPGFSRLGTMVGRAGVDQHAEKLLEARQRFCMSMGSKES